MCWTDVLESVNITTALVFLSTLLLVYFHTKRQNGVPPGPNLLPVIGNIHVVASSDLLGTLAKLRRTYGDVFGLYIGGKLTIFLNGYEAIHEAFLKKGSIFKRRPQSKLYENKGIIFTNDSLWKEQRSFAQKALNAICFSNKSKNISEIIGQEVEDLTNRLGLYTDSFDIANYLNLSVSNVIMRVVFRHRCDLDDPGLTQFLEALRGTANDFFIRDAIYSCLPFLSYLPTRTVRDRRSGLLKGFVAEFIKKAETKTEGSSSELSSFVSLYAQQMDFHQINDTKSTLNEDNMQMSAYQLFSAGSDTTSGTINWIVLHLIRHPEIQDRMFNEMHNLIGDGLVQITHKGDLPFVQAVILEGLRIASVAPFGIPHSVSEDMQFRGFLFPKNCSVISNISSVLTDPFVWPEPEEFRPERFLSKDGKEIIVPPQFIPFSLGPRSCLGETLARMEVFLYVASIIKTFILLPEVDGQLPPITGVLGLTYHPLPYKMRVIKREC